jgi:serine/threonine protein kinase
METLIDQRYRPLRKLGEGGMGIVLEAEHVRLGHRVAIKVLRGAAPGVTRERFEREARLLARLRHPALVDVLDAGVDVGPSGERPYFVMPRLEGCDGWQALRAGPLRPARALEVARDVLGALEVAHRAGVVHRDVKPSNVFLGRGGSTWLLDLGLAKVAGEALTVRGARPGTPRFLAPEQIGPTPHVDEKTDVHAVGLVLFHLLTGRGPFDHASDALALRHALRHERAPRLSALRPELPSSLDVAVASALAKDGRARPSAAELRRALARPLLELMTPRPRVARQGEREQARGVSSLEVARSRSDWRERWQRRCAASVS